MMKMRVYYDDTDAGGIVYHSNYLKFCERARSEYVFSSLNSQPFNDGFCFVVRDIKAKFIKSAKLGDILDIKTKCVELKNASALLHQEIWRENELLFSADINIAHLSHNKPSKMNEKTKQLLANIT